MDTEHIRTDANMVARAVKSNQIGDILNHVNSCTAIRLYVDSKHPFCRGLSESLSHLPASQGADPIYDFLLRLGAAALLEVDTIERVSQAMLNGFRILDGDSDAILPHSIPTEYMLNIWRQDRLNVLSAGFLSNLLFVQYVARLHKILDIDISETERVAVAHQGVGTISVLDAVLPAEKALQIIASKLMLTVSCYQMEIDVAAESILKSAFRSQENMLKILKYDDSKFKLNDSNIEQACFIAYNSKMLERYVTTDDIEIFKDVSNAIIKDALSVGWGVGDVRKTALKLCGLKTFMTSENVEIVASEFRNASEWDIFLKAKELLSEFASYSSEMANLLQSYSIQLGAITVEGLKQLSSKMKFSELNGPIQHPCTTLISGKGDCRAITMLNAILAATSGINASIVLYPGIALNDKNNHVFIEVYDELSPFTPKGQFIDQPEGIKFIQNIKHPNALIRYPIDWLVQEKSEIILKDITEAFFEVTN